MDTFWTELKGIGFLGARKKQLRKFLVRKMSQNDHYLECDLDDEAEGLGAYWGGSVIVYVGTGKVYLSKMTCSSLQGFWKVM
jgi:hypothetical protein